MVLNWLLGKDIMAGDIVAGGVELIGDVQSQELNSVVSHFEWDGGREIGVTVCDVWVNIRWGMVVMYFLLW